MSKRDELKKARDESDFLARRCTSAVLAGNIDKARQFADMWDKVGEEYFRLSCELNEHGDEV